MNQYKEGYFLAKREMLDSIDNRIAILEDKKKGASRQYIKEANVIIKTLETTRSYIRNVMLWNGAKITIVKAGHE